MSNNENFLEIAKIFLKENKKNSKFEEDMAILSGAECLIFFKNNNVGTNSFFKVDLDINIQAESVVDPFSKINFDTNTELESTKKDIHYVCANPSCKIDLHTNVQPRRVKVNNILCSMCNGCGIHWRRYNKFRLPLEYRFKCVKRNKSKKNSKYSSKHNDINPKQDSKEISLLESPILNNFKLNQKNPYEKTYTSELPTSRKYRKQLLASTNLCWETKNEVPVLQTETMVMA